MANKFVLVLDAGTSAFRSIVFDEHGLVVGSCIRQWSYACESDAPSLARSFDPESLWESLCQLVKGGLKDAHIEPGQVAAVCVSSQRQAVVFLDEAEREVYAGPNLDLRAVFEGAAIDDEMGDVMYQTTGHLPSFLLAQAKLRWFQFNRLEAYGKITRVLTLGDWITWRLSGAMCIEPTLASEAGLLDIGRREWCSDLFDRMDLPSVPAPLAEAGTLAGAVTVDAAAQTGLIAGTPVAIGGADSQCGLLGMGASLEGQVGIVAGWSTPLQMLTSRPVLSPDGKTWAGCYFKPGQWVLESSAGDVGAAYRWLAATLFSGDDDPFRRMEALAGAVPVGSEDTLAFLGPSRMDMTRLGMVTGGFLFPVPLTFTDMGPGHLVRASLEATAYAVKANLEQIEGLVGVEASDIVLGGGMTRTAIFPRILTDVIGRPLGLSPAPNVSALGAYLCARTALGEFASLEEAAQSVVSRLQCLEPDPLDSAQYEDHYQQWMQLSEQLQR